MSTYDVPGANPANADTLGAHCWARHKDGSLLYVKGSEGGDVIYEIYEPRAGDFVVRYPDVQPVEWFKKSYSYPPIGKSKEQWEWHDKTPFPWAEVLNRSSQDPHGRMVITRDHPTDMTAATRIREALQLRTERVAREAIQHETQEPARRGFAVMDKIRRAMARLK